MHIDQRVRRIETPGTEAFYRARYTVGTVKGIGRDSPAFVHALRIIGHCDPDATIAVDFGRDNCELVRADRLEGV